MAATVDLAHVFVGCNAISNAFCANSSASQTQMLNESHSYHAAFAAKNAVALVGRDPQNAELLKIKQTLQHRVSVGDATRITSVFLISSRIHGRVLAGDSEGNVFLWQRTREQDDWQLINLSSIPQEETSNKRLSTSSVAAVAVAETISRWLYFVSFSDGILVVFEQLKPHPDRVTVLVQLDLGVRCIMETLAVCTVPVAAATADCDEANVLLAAGGVDSKVYLYEVPANASTLSQLLVLEGHRGWIRGLAFEKQQHKSPDNNGSRSLFLASASQDHRVRLWKVTANLANDATSSSTTATNETRDGFLAAGTNCSYTVSFDALLIGHEDWVTSLEWTLVANASQSAENQPTTTATFESALVSSSMDNALIVWKKNMQLGTSGAWFPSLRVGEMGGNGILRGVVLPNGEDNDRLDLLALSFMGQLERWKQQPSPSKIFLPSPSLTGHCSSVTDLSWSPTGDYLLSVSLDQTARVLAPMKKSSRSWHEISRAQVHGYDLNCACFLLGESTEGGNDRFVSGADEKILRVFEAPDDIQALVSKLSGLSVSVDIDASSRQPRVQNAYLPELSLTNKTGADASSSDSKPGHDGYAVIDSQSPDLRLPVGDTLGKKTLWPEQRKLYGHGNELLCVASSHSCSLIASACKSREERFASIWLWNTSDWSVAQTPLEGHKSSVVQLAFSPNDQFLLSVSRDRQFCVYEKGPDGKFALSEKLKAHKRIIWSCSWSPDSRYFATASRDQMLAVWGRNATGSWSAMAKMVALDSAATAVAFAPLVSPTMSYIVGVGMESGAIKLFRVTPETADSGSVGITLICDVNLADSPSATVTRLTWSPFRQDPTQANSLVLAASSNDYSVRLYNVQLGK